MGHWDEERGYWGLGTGHWEKEAGRRCLCEPGRAGLGCRAPPAVGGLASLRGRRKGQREASAGSEQQVEPQMPRGGVHEE